MTRSTLRQSLLVASLLCSGCASSGRLFLAPDAPGSARSPTGQALAPQAAWELVAPGRSSKAGVNAQLGKAIVIAFDSGQEVWVYRWAGPDPTPRGATELVLLFDLSGVVTKARLRPGYAARE